MCRILKKSSGFISETVDSWEALLPTIVDVVNSESKHNGRLKSSLKDITNYGKHYYKNV